MAHNAKAGGEIGANGEFYKGGQFVADSPDTVKGARKYRGNDKSLRRVPVALEKCEVKHFDWVQVRTEKVMGEINDRQISLFDEFEMALKYDWKTDFKKKFDDLTIKFEPDETLPDAFKNALKIAHDLYLAGERVISIDRFIEEIGGDEYFYKRYCKQWLEKHYPYYDEKRYDELNKR